VPEAIKYHTGSNIWESKDSLDLAKNIMNLIHQYSNKTKMKILSSSITFEPVSKRLTDLDIKSGYIKSREFKYYTEYSNLPLNIAIELKTRLKIEEEFQKLTRGGHLFDFRLEEPAPTEEVFSNYVKRIIDTLEIGLFTFTRDYIYCPRCKQISYGLYSKCPSCEYDGEKLMLYTRVFGRIKPSLFWTSEERDFATSVIHYIL
ncbi:MAG: anaerobic ribonucleoside-triphosphate reductase, partial [Candidatus Methanomethyliaceae archaeon]|nr:anaerobic ribonucleoside-triphosphate reductase [Candidatus Methanomethyliaceae archaeon]